MGGLGRSRQLGVPMRPSLSGSSVVSIGSSTSFRIRFGRICGGSFEYRSKDDFYSLALDRNYYQTSKYVDSGFRTALLSRRPLSGVP